jgi:POT family proton-dependent oligopeptide transporter
MTETTPAEWIGPRSKKQFLGHPVGLFVLFFTEMWERFSYYGMRGLLKLYLVNFLLVSYRQTLQGKAYDGTGNPNSILGLGFLKQFLPRIDPASIVTCVTEKTAALVAGDPGKGVAPVAADLAHQIATQTCTAQPNASVLYGWYTGLVYLTPIIGGYLADRYVGQKRSVYIGGTIMAIGQFTLFASSELFFVGLGLLIIGNGFFKPNISTQVGHLYAPGDARRDGAFTIFYMGINLGSFICNFICGTLAAFFGWRYGFLAAGIGMCIGVLVQLLFGPSTLAPDSLQQRKAEKGDAKREPLTKNEWTRVGALLVIYLLITVFWAVYEQQGNTMQTWADEKTIWPSWASSTWFQSVNPLFILLLAPLLNIFWRKQEKRNAEPSSVTKMAIGCFLLGGSYIVMVLGAMAIGSGKGSLLWPVGATLIATVGELYLSPIGLSLVTKVAPAQIVSLMMGCFFLANFLGNILCGYIGQLYTTMPAQAFFVLLMALGCGAGFAIWAFNRPLRAAMGSHSK